jgi:hypothetical protein
MGMTSDDGTTTTTLRDLSLLVGGGVHNPDGSTGLNIKADATLVSAQVEQDLGGGNRITLGVHLGAGAEGSVGTSNVDADAHQEYCMRVSAFGFIAGGCVELGQVADAALGRARDTLGLE